MMKRLLTIWTLILFSCVGITLAGDEQPESATFHIAKTAYDTNGNKWRRVLSMLWMDAPTEPGVRACVVTGNTNFTGFVVTNSAGELLDRAKLTNWVDNGYETFYTGPSITNPIVYRYNVSMAQTGNTLTEAKRVAWKLIVNVPANKLRIDRNVDDQDALSASYGLWRPTVTNVPPQ